MKSMYKIIIIVVILAMAVGVAVALIEGNAHSKGEIQSYNASALNEKLAIDMDNWSYDKKNDIYYQIGLVYCMNPEDTAYESCGIYVPGEYFEASKNSNGTYSCVVKNDARVGNYTASQAPIAMPINTPGYSSCTAPTTYNAGKIKYYTDEGFIYLNAGCRGKDNGKAPDGVTDLKSAVMYYRFNGDVLPGDSERIFTFGHSGGGAQSAILGASGNSELYNPYLESIGAAMVDKNGNELSNAVAGAMCWCPITSFDTADASYEWNLGQYVRDNSSFTYELSKDLSGEYAKYINDLAIKDPDGNTLTLEESDNGIYASGSYYDYLFSITEESLNNFLNDTTFPYTPEDGGKMQSEDGPSGEDLSDIGNEDSSASSQSYQTPQDYIDSLNDNETWIEYDSATNTAKITSIKAFVKHCKNPSKSTPAFDFLNSSQTENELFSISDNGSAHFDKTVADLLGNNTDKYSKYDDFSSDYLSEFKKDLVKTDSQNNSIQTRVDMYNPMYYLCDYYNGSGSSDVAQYWRINTGIEQGDTSQCVDVNLYLAVLSKVGSDNVEFSTVWAHGHTRAERTGSSNGNFISWVNSCLNK